MCFLQRPEGELRSSSSWPLHHCSDTDRLHHLYFLTPSRPAPFLSSSSFTSLSIPLTQYSSPSCCCPPFFPLAFALQELIKSVSFDPLLMSGLWFLLFSTLVLYNASLVYSSPPCFASSRHLTLCPRDTSNQYLNIAHSLIPRIFPTPLFFSTFTPIHPSTQSPSRIFVFVNSAEHDGVRKLSLYISFT